MVRGYKANLSKVYYYTLTDSAGSMSRLKKLTQLSARLAGHAGSRKERRASGPQAAMHWHVSSSSLPAVGKRTLDLHSHPGLSAIAIAVGEGHTCAIASGNGVKCWGSNGYGQLGIGSTTDQGSPADVAGAASRGKRWRAEGGTQKE